MTIAENYICEREHVAQAARDAGRNPDDVLLLAVSKTVDVNGAREAQSAGACAFGENRPEELVKKATALPDVAWHFIGNIQSRRIPEIVEHAALIHSVHTEKHAQKISDAAADLGKLQDILVEVNVSGEESKSGATPQETLALVKFANALPAVRVRGLMTMAPQGNLQVARQTFEGLAQLHASIKAQLPYDEAEAFDQISAGMTEDWQEAVKEGSTIVRLGRAIFAL